MLLLLFVAWLAGVAGWRAWLGQAMPVGPTMACAGVPTQVACAPCVRMSALKVFTAVCPG